MNAITRASSAACRVGQLIRLLASDKDGEVVAAANAIRRTLCTAGMDMHCLATIIERGRQRPPPLPPRPFTIAETIAYCAERDGALSNREKQFIFDLEGQLLRFGEADLELSDKQRGWLAAIFTNVRNLTS